MKQFFSSFLNSLVSLCVKYFLINIYISNCTIKYMILQETSLVYFLTHQ